jgi:hypothetical protein
MDQGTPLTDPRGEVRELNLADLARFRPAQDALPAGLYQALVNLNRRRGPESTHPGDSAEAPKTR